MYSYVRLPLIRCMRRAIRTGCPGRVACGSGLILQFSALDGGRVEVSGTKFVPTSGFSVKLEGAKADCSKVQSASRA